MVNVSIWVRKAGLGNQVFNRTSLRYVLVGLYAIANPSVSVCRLSTHLLSWLKFLAMFIRHLSHPLTFMQLEQTRCTVLMEPAFGIVIVVHWFTISVFLKCIWIRYPDVTQPQLQCRNSARQNNVCRNTALPGEFLAHTVQQKWTATVTSSNGVLTVPARPEIPYSWAKERAHTLSEPGSSNYAISSQLALFRATTFSKTRHCVFLLLVSLSFSASLFLVFAIHIGGSICLQCFDAVGWVAGRASGL